MKHVLPFLSLLLACALAQAAPRVALVIGNNAYRDLAPSMQLTSPAHDAADVAAALQKLGYTLVGGTAVVDATREQITAATEQFATAARGAEAAVFYFSGHGIQVGEDNYLLPSDTPKLTGLSMLKNRAVLLRDSVMVALEEAGAASKVIILDCCRDNPFSAQLETALAQVGKSVKTKSVGEITGYGPGFYLAFATSPGSTAADGNGERNSPFTTAFLKALPGGAGKDIDFFFRDVKALLPDDQVSWTNHSIKGSFALIPLAASAPTAPVPGPPSSPAAPVAAKGFTNTLGMKFVRVPGTQVMMCIHETRNADYTVYAAAQSGVDKEWRKEADSGKEQHPVVYVSYDDAEGFCRWLSTKEGKSYRLPTDVEWSAAVGLVNEIGASPEEKDKNGAKDVYPWENRFPPGPRDGNYYGAVDGFDGSAPVMNFRPNPLGIYDLGGNVAEWCQDWHDARNVYRVQRGASHGHDPEPSGYSCSRVGVPSSYRSDSGGFRCVLMADSLEYTSAAVGPNWIVNVAPSDTLSIRSGPSNDYPVLARLSANRKVMLLGDSVKNGTIEWVKIKLPGGQIGWAAKKFVSVAASPPLVKTDFEKGTVITFPNGQIFTLEPGKGLLGPSSDPESQIPFTNADGSIVALNEQPGRQMSFIHIYLKGKDGRFKEVMDVNDSILDAGPRLKNRIPAEFIRVERVDGNLLDVTTVDLSSDTNKEIKLRVKVSSNGKIEIVP